MKVLVAGGKGFIGNHCVKALRTAGHDVLILGRDAESVSGFVRGDITEPETLGFALEGIEAVVHCVGLILEPRGVSFESVVRDGTRNLVDAAVKAGVARFVFISALGTRPNAVARYHRTKWEAEEAIRASGIPCTIFRPSVVFGPGDGFINKFLHMPVIPLAGGGKNRLQPIFVEDLARLVAETLATSASVNQTLDAGGPEKMSFREVMQTALKVAGKRKPMIPIPMLMMRILSAVFDPFQRILPPLALFTRDQYKMLQEDNTGDNGPLQKTFPLVRLTPFLEGLQTYKGPGSWPGPRERPSQSAG